MPRRSHVSFLVVLAVQLTLVSSAHSDEALDLAVEPDDVRPPAPPLSLELDGATPTWAEEGPGEPGWSVRPEIELELDGPSNEDEGLRSLDPELESLGLRLKRTW